MNLADLIKQPRFASAGQEAVLNVVATESWIAGEIADALEPYGITPAQYNVLRILRGAQGGCYTCSDIAERLLDRTPDVTRLLDRLQRAHLLTRCRAEHDRRVVHVSITEKGRDLLNRLDAPMEALMARLTRHLSEDEHRTLSALLEKLRTDQV